MISRVFIGGTGRSGTTILGALLGHHSHIWATFPRELRFLTDRFGLLDLVIGGTLPSRLPRSIKEKIFLEHLNKTWWYRVGPDGSERGLHRGILPAEFKRAESKFKEAKAPQISRAIELLDMVDKAAIRNNAIAWIDTSPANAMNAHRLTALLPDALVIHVIRDGRDVCASVITKAWGPNEPMKALEWWRRRMLLSYRGMELAPKSQVMSLVLEELLVTDREDRYKELLRFFGINDEPDMHTFFTNEMTVERGHVGRWKNEIPTHLHDRFQTRYGEIWKELNGLGAPLAPLE